MFLTVLPLRTIIFQVLFLLISVAIEAVFLQWRLKIGRRKSVEYAAFMNLLSTLLGWLIFFFMIPQLSKELKAQFLSYIFYGNFLLKPPHYNPASWLILLSIVSFFVFFFVKSKSIELFQAFIENSSVSRDFKSEKNPNLSLESAINIGNKIIFGSAPPTKTLTQRSPGKATIFSRRQSLAILWGHLISNSLILLILFLRNKFFENP